MKTEEISTLFEKKAIFIDLSGYLNIYQNQNPDKFDYEAALHLAKKDQNKFISPRFNENDIKISDKKTNEINLNSNFSNENTNFLNDNHLEENILNSNIFQDVRKEFQIPSLEYSPQNKIIEKNSGFQDLLNHKNPIQFQQRYTGGLEEVTRKYAFEEKMRDKYHRADLVSRISDFNTPMSRWSNAYYNPRNRRFY